MRLSAPLALCLLLGCSPEPVVQRQARAILNGVADPGHPAIGAFAGPPGPCTATLVGPRTVLLAAHCIKGTGASTFALGAQSYPVAEVKPHPDWHEEKAGWTLSPTLSVHDIGIALLTDKVAGIAPMRIALQTPKVGDPVSLIGLGSGTRQKADNLVGAIGEEFVVYGTKGWLIGTNGLTCMGDSGGPTLIVEEGEERVLGVHSMSNCASYTPGGATYVQDTRVSTHLDWLKAQSAELEDRDAGPPPDQGSPRDRGGSEARPDAKPASEAGQVNPPDSGCSVGGAGPAPGGALLLLLLLGIRRVLR